MLKIEFENEIFRYSEIEIMPFETIKKRQATYNSNSPFQPHIVNFYCLNFITEGQEGIHKIDFISYNYSKGNVVITAKGQVHEFVTMPSHDGILLTFTENYLIELSHDYQFPVLRLGNNFLYHPVVQLEQDTFDVLIHLLKLAAKERSNFKKTNWEVVKSYVKIILLKVLASSNRNLNNMKNVEVFIHFQKLLLKNFMYNKNVRFYADLLNLTPKKLSLITKKIVGQTAKEYINSILLLEAKRLLKGSNVLVKEVCYKLGFDSPTNFTKFFKKQEGLTPNEFLNSKL